MQSFDLRDCLALLESQGRLVRVKTEIDPAHELAGVAALYEGREAVLFERVKGHAQPVACGLFWNRDNLGALFGCSARELPFLFAKAVADLRQQNAGVVVVDEAPAQEHVFPEPDLGAIPTPTLALKDGGPYYASSVVIARDPDTGVRNASVHRMMVTGKTRMTMLMDIGRHLRDYYERAERAGRPLEITINNGVDPSVYFAAITPSSAVPIDMDELSVASLLRGEPVRLCRSRTVAVEGVADAQMIVEAEILPGVREPEGPFGEVTGYYASRDDRWVVNVKAVTSRKNPIVQTLLPGQEVWNSVGLTAEANIFQSVSRQVPGLKGVYLSHGGCGFYHAIVQIDPPRDGMAKNAILATFAAFPPLRMVTAVNGDVDLFDAEDVQRAMATRYRPDEDTILVPNAFGHELNPATDGGVGTKVGFDCTVPLPVSPAYERVAFMQVDPARYEVEKRA